MKKDLIIKKNKRRKLNWILTISNQIKVNYRNYALYVLENRGIPSFYDSLTNIQRVILNSASSNFEKTLNLIGTCFGEGYHHGDKSLINAINKLARTFNTAEEMLIGDGFFGTSVDSNAAQARYTRVKINPKIQKLIKENSFLNTRDEDKKWDPLWVKYPIGLITSIIGIGVGYKSTVLPRNLEDIKKYFNGEIKEVYPYFKNFNGKVKRYEKLKNVWLIEGAVKVNDTLHEIQINDLPPMLKFQSFIKKIERILEKFEGKASIINNSTVKANFKIKFKGVKNDWEFFKNIVLKSTKMLITESPIFIKDGQVLIYDSIEEYLEDFKYRRAQLEIERFKYFLNVNKKTENFTEAKIKFLKFMLTGKKTEKQIDNFLSKFDKNISVKLDGILLKHLTDDELKRCEEKIKELAKEYKEIEKELAKHEKEFKKLEDKTSKKGIKNKKNESIDLFSFDADEVDGIEMYDISKDIEDPDEDPDEDNE